MSELQRLSEAVQYAAEQHRDQRRKNKSKAPYINHPIEVMTLVSKETQDVEVLMAAVLHDVIEDTKATKEDIESRFGKRVASIVMEVTDDKSLPKVERKKRQITHALEISPAAKLVKMADKYSNIKDLLQDPPTFWSQDEIRGYFIWCHAVCKNLYNSYDPSLESPLCTSLRSLFAHASIEVTFDALERYYSAIEKKEKK